MNTDKLIFGQRALKGFLDLSTSALIFGNTRCGTVQNRFWDTLGNTARPESFVVTHDELHRDLRHLVHGL